VKKLSIIMPSIRLDGAKLLIDSIDYSNYELIIIGPYSICNLQDYIIKNKLETKVKLVTDYGSPVRATQIGISLATGDIITLASDDGTYYQNQLSKVMQLFEDDQNKVISCRYTEHDRTLMHPYSYFTLKGLDHNIHPEFTWIPEDWVSFLMYFMNRSLFEELGGLDCEFQSPAPANDDLAVRGHLANCNIIFYDEPVIHYTWLGPGGIMPHLNPEHKPIELAQWNEDKPRFDSKDFYTKITIDNWKKSPTVWTKRFNF
jgi:hypothetical protein